MLIHINCLSIVLHESFYDERETQHDCWLHLIMVCKDQSIVLYELFNDEWKTKFDSWHRAQTPILWLIYFDYVAQ